MTRNTALRLFDFDLVLTAAFACVVGMLLCRHAMFADEAQEWLIARASHGIGELYRNRRYEGHPLTWYLAIYPFARLSGDIGWIRLPNFFISIAACYLTCRLHLKSPAEKVLFAFGALMVFYYAVLARPYMLGYLLLLLACHYAAKPGRTATTLVLAGLLATLHAYFVIIAGALLIWHLSSLGPLRALPGRLGRRGWAARAFAAICFALTMAQIATPADGVLITADTQPSLFKLPALLARAMAPVWGDRAPFALFLLPVCWLGWLAWRTNPRTAIFLALSAGTLLLVQSLVYGNGAWHAGTVFLAILATIYLLRADPSEGKPRAHIDALLLVFLGLQFLNGLPLIGLALHVPASDGKLAASFLETYCPAACTYVGAEDVPGAAISAYLEGRPIYYVNRGEFGTYAIRDNRRMKPNDPAHVADAAKQFAHPIMIFTRPLSGEDLAREHMRLLAFFPPAMTAERFFLYVFD